MHKSLIMRPIPSLHSIDLKRSHIVIEINIPNLLVEQLTILSDISATAPATTTASITLAVLLLCLSFLRREFISIEIGPVGFKHDILRWEARVDHPGAVLVDGGGAGDAADVEGDGGAEVRGEGGVWEGEDVGDGEAARGSEEAVDFVEDVGFKGCGEEVEDAVGYD